MVAARSFKNARMLGLAAFAAAVWGVLDLPRLAAQFQYPRTRSQPTVEPRDVFSISPPRQSDSAKSGGDRANDYRSMSPDSWESPQPRFDSATSPFQPTPNQPTPFQPTPQPMSGFQGAVPNGTQRTVAEPLLEKLPAANPGATQQPNLRDFQPSVNPFATEGSFRSTSHPLNKTEPLPQDRILNRGNDPLPEAPGMPENIRLPDLLPPSVFSNQSRTPTEALPQLPASPMVSGDTEALPQLPASPMVSGGESDRGSDELLLPGASGTRMPDPMDTQSVPGFELYGQHPDVVVPPADAQGQGRSRRPRRPPLTPSMSPPRQAPITGDSPNRVASEYHDPAQNRFGFPNDKPVPPGTAWPLTSPDYRPDLGHRLPHPVTRELAVEDHGQKFDHEQKHVEYPKFGEILATGKYFGSSTVQYLRPSFQANTSLFRNQSGVTETFDFAYKMSPQFRLGFESKYGPGIELEYWGYHDFSRVTSFTSDGIETATTSAWMRGANQWSRISAVNAGETLSARHRMEVDVLGASFFKEVKLPISRINGKFGFQTAHIIHELVAQVNQASGTEVGNLRSRSDVRGFGPQFEIEYFRPVGHTKIEFLTTASGSVLFGKQSQVILNSTGANQSRLKADEFVMTFEFFSGAQYRKMFGENRYWFARAGMQYQAWLHGGTAVLPQDDFGLRGFALMAGVNR